MPSIINKVIKILIFNNVVLNLAWGFMVPVFAIFILQEVAFENAIETAKIIGIAELCFTGTRVLVQIPIGKYLDRNHGEKDDFWFMVAGTFIQAFIPIGLLFSSQARHIYALQALHGLGASLTFPSWSAMFTRHMDKEKEAVEWSVQSTFAHLAVGISAGASGFALAIFGFNFVFMFVSLFTFVSGILLFLIKNDVSPIDKNVIRIPIQVRR